MDEHTARCRALLAGDDGGRRRQPRSDRRRVRVTAFSAKAALGRYADCARAMGVAPQHDEDGSGVSRLLKQLAQLNRDLSVLTPKAYGIDEQRWQKLYCL